MKVFIFQLKLSRNFPASHIISKSIRCVASKVNFDSLPPKSREIINRESNVICHNYAPVPAVISHGKGVHLFDVDGNKYFDFLSGFSTTNQGHCHPKIVQALVEQASTLHHTSRAFHTDLLFEYGELITKLFGYVRNVNLYVTL